MPEDINLSDILEGAIAQYLDTRAITLPGSVVSYDRITQTCEARINIRHRRDNSELIAFPNIQNVPVMFWSGSAGSVTIDLLPGDPLLLQFCDRDIDHYKSAGGVAVEPSTPRRLDITDAVAFPAFLPKLFPLGLDAHAAGAVVHKGDDIRLGSSAAFDFIALSTLVLTELNAMRSVFNKHTHAAFGAPPTPDPIPPVIPIPAATSVAATKVKAE